MLVTPPTGSSAAPGGRQTAMQRKQRKPLLPPLPLALAPAWPSACCWVQGHQGGTLHPILLLQRLCTAPQPTDGPASVTDASTMA